MDPLTARRIIESLADGLDPFTGQGIGPDSPLQSPDVVRALQTALIALDKQIGRSERDAAKRRRANRAEFQTHGGHYFRPLIHPLTRPTDPSRSSRSSYTQNRMMSHPMSLKRRDRIWSRRHNSPSQLRW